MAQNSDLHRSATYATYSNIDVTSHGLFWLIGLMKFKLLGLKAIVGCGTYLSKGEQHDTILERMRLFFTSIIRTRNNFEIQKFKIHNSYWDWSHQAAPHNYYEGYKKMEKQMSPQPPLYTICRGGIFSIRCLFIRLLQRIQNALSKKTPRRKMMPRKNCANKNCSNFVSPLHDSLNLKNRKSGNNYATLP